MVYSNVRPELFGLFIWEYRQGKGDAACWVDWPPPNNDKMAETVLGLEDNSK